MSWGKSEESRGDFGKTHARRLLNSHPKLAHNRRLLPRKYNNNRALTRGVPFPMAPLPEWAEDGKRNP